MRLLPCVFALSVAFLAIACTPHERLPPAPGGGNPGSGGSAMGGDAGSGDAGDGPVLLTGQVCRVVDLRNPAACVPTANLSGITVVVQGSGESAVTDADGVFAIAVTPSSSLVLRADGIGFESTVLPLRLQDGFDGVVVPLADSSAWLELLAILDVLLPQGTGSLAVYLRQDGAPVLGTELTDISASSGIFYDGLNPQDWIAGGLTGPAGAVLVFGVNAPVAEFTTVDPSDGVFTRVSEIPVVGDAITFLTVDL